MRLTNIARELAPFIRQLIYERIGAQTEVEAEAGSLTTILGTSYPTSVDYTNERGTDTVDFQAESSDGIVPLADKCVVLRGSYAMIEEEAEASVAGGYFPYVYKNKCTTALGLRQEDAFDSQLWIIPLSGEIDLTSSWQTIDELFLPPDYAFTFDALVAGTESRVIRNYGYKIVGLANRNGSTTTLTTHSVTTLYTDDSYVNFRCLADDTNDSILFQVKDTGNSGRKTRWIIRTKLAGAYL